MLTQKTTEYFMEYRIPKLFGIRTQILKKSFCFKPKPEDFLKRIAELWGVSVFDVDTVDFGELPN